MLEMKSEFHVKGLSAKTAVDWVIDCTPENYCKWWPGTHLALKYIKTFPGHIGNVACFDEYVGKNRLQMTTTVVKYVPGKEILWKLDKGRMMPAWMTLEGKDTDDGVTLSHAIRVGFNGIGCLLDPIYKLFFPAQLRKDLHEHAVTEFNKLPGFMASLS